MRRLSLLALPLTMLALGVALFASPPESLRGPGATSVRPNAAPELRQAETGQPIAVTRTHWQETSDGTPFSPPSPSGLPER